MSAFDVSLKAYEEAKAKNITQSDTFVYIDFTKPSTQKRMFVIKDGKEVFSTYVTHGSGSGRGILPTQFSNTNNSHMSSIGVYKTAEKYTGKHGLSRRLDGLEFTNDGARERAVVIHSANYIGNGKTGTSWGCPAVPINDIKTILNYTTPGTILVIYYPDKNWLSKSKFLN